MAEEQNNDNYQNNENQKEWYQHGWGLLFAILLFPFFLIWYAWAKSSWNKNTKIAVTVVCAIFLIFVMSIDSDYEPSESNTAENSQEEQTPEESSDQPPDITADQIDYMTASMEEEFAVEDAAVSVEDDTVSIALVVGAATAEEEVERLLENAARQLGMFVAVDNDDLEGPDGDSLGELWDFYDLRVVGGPSSSDPITQGVKVSTSPNITW